ncbi:hypothetical protein ACR79K_25370 [Sphingobacterium siyangense]|uniref:hypothetical protein n=1 Tax=Sphingobacterium siyangense TaxID=459529 RepID=UPI003DA58AA4
MRRLIIIGANLGLTGCQLIQLHEFGFILKQSGVDLIDAVQGLQRVANKVIIERKELQSLIVKAGKELSPFRQPFKEKKPKYIRQQHKLAQRNYRRK